MATIGPSMSALKASKAELEIHMNPHGLGFSSSHSRLAVSFEAE